MIVVGMLNQVLSENFVLQSLHFTFAYTCSFFGLNSILIRSSDVVNPGNNLHVSGISLRVEDRDLEELFSKYGKVSDYDVDPLSFTLFINGVLFVGMNRYSNHN